MTRENYDDFSREDLVREVKKLKKRKKYGIVWDEERTKEQFEKNVEGKLPVLEEITTKEIVTNKTRTKNILIEGDNYHALSVLNYTHKGAIDVIYIDPPYNTGNRTWKYNNAFVEKDDDFRHSKWLSFIQKRKREGFTLILLFFEVHRLKRIHVYTLVRHLCRTQYLPVLGLILHLVPAV